MSKCRFASVLGLLVLLQAGCSLLSPKPEAPIVGLAGLQVAQVTLFEQRYQLQLRIQNPNDFALPINGLRCTLFINEQEFATGVSAAAVTVPRFGEARLALDVVSDLRHLLQQLRAAGGAQAGTVSYRLKGKVALAGYGYDLPFEYQGEFDLGAANL